MAFAVRQRNGAPQWTWPEELSRLARRNPTYAPEPHDIAADPLRPTGKTSARRAQDMLPDPLRSQLRALVALRDARYALVPVEIRFEPRGGGAGRAVLHLALVDTRAAQVVWAGDVASD